MTSDRWPEIPLGNVITLKRGHDLPTDRRQPGSVPVVSSAGVTGFHDVAKCKAPGVVTGRYGTLGDVFYLDEDYWPLNTALYVEDFKGNDPRFVSYLLRTVAFQSANDKSTVPGLNRNDLHKLLVSDVPKDEQGPIGSVLGALDDKIDLNAKMNETLLELIVTSWRRAQRDMVCTRIPLSEMAEYVNGGAFTKGADGVGRPIIRIRELNGGVSDATPRSSINPSPDQVACAGDLLFSWSGSLDVYRWFGPESLINQHIFKVLPRAPFPQWSVYLSLQEAMPLFQGIARDKATTMGHIKRQHLSEVLVQVPVERLTELDAIVSPMYGMIGRNEDESRSLAEMRDLLMPRLISGTIRANGAIRG